MMKTAIYHRGNRFNGYAIKDMLNQNFLDYDHEFPHINKGDWVAIYMHDDTEIKYGLILDIFIYSPYKADISNSCEDLYYVKTIEGIYYECRYDNIYSHVSTHKIKGFLKELKNKTKKIE